MKPANFNEYIGKEVFAWDNTPASKNVVTLIAIVADTEYPYICSTVVSQNICVRYKHIEPKTEVMKITSGGITHTIEFIKGGIMFDGFFIYEGTIAHIYRKLKELGATI